MLLVILMMKNLLQLFMRKNCKKEFRIKSITEKKGDKLYVYIIEYFPKPKSLGANVKVELDLSDYAKKNKFKK